MEHVIERLDEAVASPGKTSQEASRLTALARYDILDTPPEESFDRLTRLAARTLDMPIALVSLVGASRHWSKSCFGLDQREMSREISFCAHVIQRGDVDGHVDRSVMVVEDATEDARFSDNPFVTGSAGIRFYAGAPLVTPDGYVLGTCCVLDTQPRTLDEEERQTLTALAEMAMDEMELRRQLAARKEDKRALQASKEEATDILESIAGAFFALDAAGRFAHVNDRAVEKLGRSRETLLGAPVGTAFPQRVAASLTAACSRAGDTQPIDTFDLYHPSLERWLAVRTRPRFNEGLSVFFTDITKRKARQKRLRLLNSAVRGAHDGVLITEAEPLDAPGPRIVFANRAFCEATGYTRAEVAGRNPRFLQGPDTDRAALDGLRDALERRESYRAEFLNYKKDGTPFWVEMDITPVTDAAGDVTHFTSVQRDVTERKRRTAALVESERRFRSVVENARDVIFQTDAQGCWTLLSPAWEEVTGYTVEESLGQSAWALVHPDDRPGDSEKLHEHADEDGTFRHEGRYQTKAGAVRHVRMNARVVADVEDGGRVEGVVGTLSDLTDTRRFESEREMRERAEELLAAKTSLLNNMSHELRTPLASIIGFAEVLEEGDGAGNQEEFAGRIAQSGKRLQNTLNSVLQIAQLDGDSKGTQLDLEPLAVGAAVEEAMDLHRPTAEEKGLSCEVQVPDASEGEVRVLLDKGALDRILDNLIGNAIKFTDEGHVTVRVSAGPEQVRIEVEDSGIGISESFLERLFEDFQQESTGINRTHEGNGLGLAIAHRLIELMGGTIDAASEKGEGSRFTVAFPRSEAP